jgi:hypothetical protein
VVVERFNSSAEKSFGLFGGASFFPSLHLSEQVNKVRADLIRPA